MNTATRLHAGDRPRDLITIATTLGRRKPPNLRLEATAWRQLSRALAADPTAALSCALDIARVLCHAGTAGLSLFKPDRAHHMMVRWELVRGALAPYEGRNTPVDCSPCGLCLDASATIVVSKPARAFTWLEAAAPSIQEQLIAPLQSSSGCTEGTVWIAHHDERSRCCADDVRILEQLAQQIVLGLRLQERATDREHALSVLQSFQAAQQALFSHDLSHERTRRLHAEAAERELRRELDALLAVQARLASSEATRALPAPGSHPCVRQRTDDGSQVGETAQREP